MRQGGLHHRSSHEAQGPGLQCSLLLEKLDELASECQQELESIYQDLVEHCGERLGLGLLSASFTA